jgi:transketolase
MGYMTQISEAFARRVRMDVIDMVHRARAAHVASSLSVVDILAVLYASVLEHRPDDPMWADRDRLVLSKGHAAAAGYAALARSGYFDPAHLATYCANDSDLAGHLTASGLPGVEMSTGSLGHGLPFGAGVALAARREERRYHVFVVMSDGECDEGTTWETALIASQHRLGNLCAVIDANGIQSLGRISDVVELEPLTDKWAAFGWDVAEIDGHDHAALEAALKPQGRVGDPPKMVIARTVKGKGVSFMEDDNLWHYRPPDDAERAAALAELAKGAR